MKIISLSAAMLGFTGVALGAFGAHALKDKLAAAAMTSVWETAGLYHLIHAAAVFAIGLHTTSSSGPLRRAAGFWIVGVILFSGSLYTMALGGPRWLGPITPLGGLCFLIGWAIAAWSSLKQA